MNLLMKEINTMKNKFQHMNDIEYKIERRLDFVGVWSKRSHKWGQWTTTIWMRTKNDINSTYSKNGGTESG